MILHPHIAQMRMEAARKRQSSFSGSRLTVVSFAKLSSKKEKGNSDRDKTRTVRISKQVFVSKAIMSVKTSIVLLKYHV